MAAKSFTFVGDDEQYFPDFGRWLSHGDEVETDVDLKDDPRFAAKAHRKPAEKSEES